MLSDVLSRWSEGERLSRASAVEKILDGVYMIGVRGARNAAMAGYTATADAFRGFRQRKPRTATALIVVLVLVVLIGLVIGGMAIGGVFKPKDTGAAAGDGDGSLRLGVSAHFVKMAYRQALRHSPRQPTSPRGNIWASMSTTTSR